MEFSSFVITNKGQALMAKLMQGTGVCTFTAIKLSSTAYTDSQLPNLTSLSNIKQTCPVSRKTVINPTSIQIEGAVDNTGLTAGYNIQSIGIFATDPTEGEILYAVARATTPGYMPPYNGVTVSGGYFKFVITVGAAANVTVTVDPSGYATIGDVQALQAEIADVKGYVGLDDETVYGVEADFANRKFSRLAGAVGRTTGDGFDDIPAFGGRYRCNLTDAGVEVAKYGDPGYTESGKLTTSITIGEGDSAVTYPVGTPVQVMVKQPKFYYKTVPLKMDKIEGGKGYHLRKARYYISMNPHAGFKVHPAFIHDGLVKDYIYLSAYEGSLYDTSAAAYIMNDDQVADFAADKLCSIANAKPISGLTQNLTRRNCGKLAENRGLGWFQSYAATAACTQLLMIIECASFDTQKHYGDGNCHITDDGATNMSTITGSTSNLGNKSGLTANIHDKVETFTYRGEENIWGNIWKFVDGLNIYADAATGDHSLYVADHGFTESTNAAPYKDCGFTLAKENGYVNAFGYTPDFDWLFMPSETGHGASSALPVGDYFYQNAAVTGWRVALSGGFWDNGGNAGAFYVPVYFTPSHRTRSIGSRSVYVPGVTPISA